MARGALHRPKLGALGPRAAEPVTVRRLRAAAWLAAAVLAVELVYVALASPRLAVRDILILGDPAISKQLAARLEIPGNTNMLRPARRALQQQVESWPAVRSAEVARAFPTKLLVKVERREAVAVLRRADEAVLVDPDGVPFTVPGEWGWGLPELSLPESAPSSRQLGTAAPDITALVEALRALAPDPRLRPARLRLAAPNSVEVTLQSGPTVKLGDPADLESKVSFLVAALEEIGPERMEYLDLRDPESAFWRPREETDAPSPR